MLYEKMYKDILGIVQEGYSHLYLFDKKLGVKYL